MWNDAVNDRYWWMKVQNGIEELLLELSRAEEEEEEDLYLLNLHFKNEVDLDFFSVAEKRLIKKLLSILMSDTEKHRNLLIEMSEELKRLGEGNVREAV